MLLAICEKKLAFFASTGNYFRPWYQAWNTAAGRRFEQ